MINQRGGVWTVVLVILVVIGLIAGVIASSYISAHNYGNTMERQLEAIKTDNRNIYAQYGQKVLEVAQVPDMYIADVVKVTTAALEGRYGPDGSKAVFQWIQEQNPNVDPSLYRAVQQVIEAGRSDFENGQRRLIDVRRQYETALGYFWQGLWLRIAGYPKVNLADFDIVSTDRADEVFRNKKESGPITLRPSASQAVEG